MKPFTALLGAAAGTHAADQLALATLPLTATLVLGAGPDILGTLGQGVISGRGQVNRRLDRGIDAFGGQNNRDHQRQR